MKLIVGLGNPTPQYEKTRHNVGFEVIDHLVEEYGIALDTAKHKGFYGKGRIEGQQVILLKPMTYMNLSGESVVIMYCPILEKMNRNLWRWDMRKPAKRQP